MLGWSDASSPATLFHELAHQVVYVPGDSEFNESFATVVEEAGLERWLAARQRKQELGVWQRTARAPVRSSSRCCSGARPSCARCTNRRCRMTRSAAASNTSSASSSSSTRSSSRAMARLWRLRPLVRSHADQRAPRFGGDVLRVRAGTAARAERDGRRSAALLRSSESSWRAWTRHARALAVCGAVSPPGIPAASDRAGS